MSYNPKKHHRKSIRLKGYDYSQEGAYFITICCQDRACLFGKITNGEMILNEMGIIAHDEWIKTTEIRQNVKLDVFVIMPNHIHGIIVLGRGESNSPDNCESHSPILSVECNSQYKMGEFDSQNIKGEFDSPLRSPSKNIGAIIRGYKSSVTKQIRMLNENGGDLPNLIPITVWQCNYYEHIIRNEQSYQTISNYIINNPLKWNEDKFHK